MDWLKIAIGIHSFHTFTMVKSIQFSVTLKGILTLGLLAVYMYKTFYENKGHPKCLESPS